MVGVEEEEVDEEEEEDGLVKSMEFFFSDLVSGLPRPVLCLNECRLVFDELSPCMVPFI